MVKTSLFLAALAAGQAWATKDHTDHNDHQPSTDLRPSSTDDSKPALNVYWGQVGSKRLASYCESTGFEYVTVSFVNNSPETDRSGLDYPGTNFGAHCSGEVYVNEANGRPSQLLSNCRLIAEDIPKCQALGKKVLLSIGGAWNPNGTVVTNYTVSGPKKGLEFADFLWGAFGPKVGSWTGPRPFDLPNKPPTVVDGFDLDVEHKFDYFGQSGYIALVQRLRQRFALDGGNYIISAAPQCPLAEPWYQMNHIIEEAKIDLLFIQFYNNEGCNADNEAGFNYLEWEEHLKTTASADAKIFIGLLGAAGSGYIEPEAAVALVNKYKDRPSL